MFAIAAFLATLPTLPYTFGEIKKYFIERKKTKRRLIVPEDDDETAF